MHKPAKIVIGLLTAALIFAPQIAYAGLSVTTSPTFSLDFSDSTKVSGTTWTDQVAGVSAKPQPKRPPVLGNQTDMGPLN